MLSIAGALIVLISVCAKAAPTSNASLIEQSPLLSSRQASIQVTIPSLGTLQGTSTSIPSVHAFLGVPFAKPLVNPAQQRFTPPQPVELWSGILDATRFKSKCVQVYSQDGNEDCLYLNIYTPANVVGPLPVMVWIHGGAFSSGAATDLDGSRIVQISGNSVIVVTIQYRLNAFGFLAIPELAQRGWTNVGLQDQRQAFLWIRQYISAFGGDPKSITAFGESAGGTSVGMHLILRNGTQSYFDRAIIQSGSPTSNPPLLTASNSTASSLSAQILSETGCNTAPSPLRCLQSLPATSFPPISQRVLSNNFVFEPVIDGSWILIDPSNSLNRGWFSRVPVIIGSNTDEGTVFVNRDVGNGYTPWLNSKFGPQFRVSSSNIIQIQNTAYPLSSFNNNVFAAASAVYGEYKYTCQVRYAADVFARYGGSVYKYRFAYARPNFTPPGNSPGFNYGAYHSADVDFTFSAPSISAAEQPLSNLMVTYWTTFAKTSNPNANGTPNWPIYTPPATSTSGGGDQIVLNLPGSFVERDEGLKSRCLFWNSVRGNVEKGLPPDGFKGDVKVVNYAYKAGVLEGVIMTPTAVNRLKELISDPQKPKYLKIGTRKKGCSGQVYTLDYVDTKSPLDEVIAQDGVQVLVDSKALFSLIGSEMDYAEDVLSAQFVFHNPNVKEMCGCGQSFMV
ncbi:hypothetical protein HDV05_000008 [Chytridiales sp. JEL 0842]|nr:hypothetical protein HDV05_000008 [Chytridiales sp. JEL 0842]